MTVITAMVPLAGAGLVGVGVKAGVGDGGVGVDVEVGTLVAEDWIGTVVRVAVGAAVGVVTGEGDG